MLSSILSNSNPDVNRELSHILSRIDYNNLSSRLMMANWRPNRAHRIILFEYVHSPVHDVIAQMERIPGTTRLIHDSLMSPCVKSALHSLLVSSLTMSIYTRRKIDPGNTITKYRQLILEILPEAPSTIFPEEELDEYE